jgi:hypothetical protein
MSVWISAATFTTAKRALHGLYRLSMANHDRSALHCGFRRYAADEAGRLSIAESTGPFNPRRKSHD